MTAKYAPELLAFPLASLLNTDIALIFGAIYSNTLTSVLAVFVRPLESVTVVVMVSVPATVMTPVVTVAAVYVLPSAVVLYDLIVDP